MKYTIAFGIILILASARTLLAEEFITSPISTEKFPVVEKSFSVVDDAGNITSGFSKSDFEVYEDGTQIDPELVEVDCYSSQAPVQVLLLIDQSTSMSEEVDGKRKIDWAKESARTFVNDIYLGPFSSIGIAVFSTEVNQLCPFTRDKERLKNILKDIPPVSASTDFNSAFLDDNGGAELLKRQPNLNRVIIFLTDGKHDSEWRGLLKQSQITYTLNRNNIELYAITFLDYANEKLNSIAVSTGGYYYQVQTPDELPDLYRLLASGLTLSDNCTISWETDLFCESSPPTRDVRIVYKPKNLTDIDSYTPGNETVFDAGYFSTFYYFGNPAPGTSSERTVILKPGPYDYMVENVYIEDNTYFEIIDYGNGSDVFPGPFQITVGTEHRIKVRFTQQVEDISRKTRLKISAYPCNSEVDLFGGRGNLVITSPQKGDIFSKCEGIEIKWEGVSGDTETDLYYKSIDNNTWQLIANNKRYLYYGWVPPDIEGFFQIKAVSTLNNGSGEILEAVSDTFKIVTPELAAGLDEVFHDSLLIGQYSKSLFENLFYNNSEVDIKIKSAYISGISGDDFTISEYEKNKLAPGEYSDMLIEFFPSDDNIRQAMINIEPDCGETLRIPILGYGICRVDVKDSLRVDTTFTGEYRDTTFVRSMKNPMDMPLNFKAYLSLNDNYDFYLTGIGSNQTVTIPPKGTYDLKVGFSPETVGEKMAKVNIKIEGCTSSEIMLYGHAVLEGVRTNDVNFGRKLYKSEFDTMYVHIKNKDAFDLAISSIDFESESPAFSADFPPPDTLLQGDSTISFPVYFTPNKPGFLDTRIQICINEKDTLYSNLSGETFTRELEIETICPDGVNSGDTGIADLFLINSGYSEPVHIDTCYFAAGSEEFSLPADLVFPSDTLIEPQDTIQIPIFYSPAEGLPHTGLVSVWADNFLADYDTTSRENIGEFICDALRFEYSPEVDLGISMVCESNTGFFEVINNSDNIDLLLYFQNARIEGSDKQSFSLIDTETVIVDPGENNAATFEIGFIPERTGRHDAVLHIPTSGGKDIEISLYGEGVEYSIAFTRKKIKYRPGNMFNQYLTLQVPEVSKGFTEFLDIEVNYDISSMDLSDTGITKIISENPEDNVYLSWEEFDHNADYGSIIAEGHGILDAGRAYDLFEFRFLGLLPQETQADMSSNTSYSCTSISDTTNAQIEADSLCAGTNRYVEISDISFYCLPPFPQPAEGTVNLKFGIGYDSHLKIEMFDNTGKTAVVLYEGTISKGYYNRQYRIPPTLSSGQYSLVFSAGTFTETFSVIISE